MKIVVLLLTLSELTLMIQVSKQTPSQLTSIVSSCTDAGVGKWNSQQISAKLSSWIQGVVTTGDRGSVRSVLYHRKEGKFMDHFAGVNDKPRKDDGGVKKHDCSVVTVGHFGDEGGELVPGRVAWQWRTRKMIDGFLYGPVDSRGRFTGDNITFLYPDMITGLRGKFVDGEMVEGREVRVVAERCRNGVKQLRMKRRKKREHLVWEREETTPTYIGKYPREADPYERRTAFINSSTVHGSMDGVFVKRKLVAGDLVAYFSGHKTFSHYIWSANMTKAQKETATAFYFAFGKYVEGYPDDMKIDVGVAVRGRTEYRTTVGHKVNHKFSGENAYFHFIIHPSFGDVVAVVANKVIEKGEEVFVDYNYNYTLEDAPQWWAEEYFKTYGKPLKSKKQEN